MLKLLKRLNRREWLVIAVSIVFIAAQVGFELAIPGYMTQITTALETKGTGAGDILRPGGVMLLCSLLIMASSIIVGYLAAHVAAGFSARIRGKVFNRVMAYSSADISKFSIPSLLTRTTNDITQVQSIIAMGMQVLIKAPITAVWAITKIANKGWQWTTATGIAIVILLVMLTLILTLVQPKFKLVQRLTDRLNLVTRENLNGIRVVHAFNAEDYQNKKFDQANQNLTRTNLFANRVLGIMNPGLTLISNGLTLAVYAIGASLIQAASGATKLTLFSNMIVFSSYAMQVIMAFLLLSIIFIIAPRVSVSAGRINNVLNVTPSVTYPSTKPTETQAPGTIVFNNVSFRFAGAEAPAITGLSFTAHPGDTIAFIGATGSGKSTVLNLLARRYDVTSGTINIDGVNIQDYPEKQLYDKLGYIPQKAVLFSGTVRSNLDYGTGANKPAPLSDKDLRTALHVAQADDLITNLDATVAQHGDNFSGGQKQRLAIARAVARKPEILMFDDSFSALDYATDAKLRQALHREAQGTTQIIVAQRISTIMDATQIIVLDQGKVVGSGTHQELLANNKVYQEIAYSQLSKKELA